MKKIISYLFVFLFVFCGIFLFLVTPSDLLHAVDKSFSVTVFKYKPSPSTFELSSGKVVVMDRGRLFLAGQNDSRDEFLLVESDTGKYFPVLIPWESYLKDNSEFRDKLIHSPKGKKNYTLDRLIAFDRDSNTCIFEGSLTLDNQTDTYFFFMDISKKQIISHIHFPNRELEEGEWLHFRRIAYDTSRNKAYFAEEKYPKNLEQLGLNTIQVTIYSLDKDSIEELGSFPVVNPSDRYYFDENDQILIPEYSESYLKYQAKAHIFKISDRTIKSVSIPTTAYGIAFDNKRNRIYAASAETGKLHSIDLKTGKNLQTLPIGGLGHALGYMNENNLGWIRHTGIQTISVGEKLKTTGTIPSGKFGKKKNTNVSGSIFDFNRAFVVDGETIYILKFK